MDNEKITPAANPVADDMAEITGELNNTGNTDTPEQKTEDKGKPERVFTQAEVEKMIQARLIKTKTETAEQMKEFNEWKEAQKTEAEKAAENLKKLEQQEKALKEKEMMITALQKGVPAENMDFVLFKASKSMDSENCSFDEALEKVMEANNHILAKPAVPANTGMKQSKTPPDGSDNELKEQIFKQMGVKI